MCLGYFQKPDFGLIQLILRVPNAVISPTLLTFQSLAGTLGSAWLKIQKFYIVMTMLLCVLYGSQNKQQLLPYKTLRDWLYNRSGECLQRGTH
jgi:hypothetical protein